MSEVLDKIEKLQTFLELDYTDNSIDYKLDENGNVISIDLYESEYMDFKDINGDLSFLNGFTKLQRLEISINQRIEIATLKEIVSLKELYIENDENEVDFSGNYYFENLKKITSSGLSLHSLEFLSQFPKLEMFSAEISREADISVFKKLKDLKDLSIWGGGFNSLLPFSHLLQLNSFSLTNCHNINDFEVIEKFANLKGLLINSCNLLNCDFISKLNNLKNISLYNNKLQDISALEGLVNLEYANINNNRIKDISAFHKLYNILGLYMNNNKIENIDALRNLSNLRILWANDNQIRDITAFEKLNNVSELHLNSNNISNIDALRNLSNLGILWANNNKIESAEVLKSLTKLNNLDLSFNKIAELPSLKEQGQLGIINISHNQISSIQNLPDKLKNLNANNNAIQYLDFSNCSTARLISCTEHHINKVKNLKTNATTLDYINLKRTSKASIFNDIFGRSYNYYIDGEIIKGSRLHLLYIQLGDYYSNKGDYNEAFIQYGYSDFAKEVKRECKLINNRLNEIKNDQVQPFIDVIGDYWEMKLMKAKQVDAMRYLNTKDNKYVNSLSKIIEHKILASEINKEFIQGLIASLNNDPIERARAEINKSKTQKILDIIQKIAGKAFDIFLWIFFIVSIIMAIYYGIQVLICW